MRFVLLRTLFLPVSSRCFSTFILLFICFFVSSACLADRGEMEENSCLYLCLQGMRNLNDLLCFYTMPCASMALATFMNPATLAPFT